ncbi:MAG: hypothetical protein J6L86_05255 [Alphaproteobacteria bacterium]|nr:hypothetical protein [Alphaproteobacteria bacterium]MBQ8630938.1 hypothetical protein [Alphaproteobacteria bacterium]
MTAEAVNNKEFEMLQEVVTETADAAAAAVENAAHHYGAFYENPEFWVGLAFVLVVVLLARPVVRMAGAMLVKRIDAIAKRINEAQQLKDDAQKMWVEYEKKYLNAKNEAYEILEKSEREMEMVKNERLRKMEEDIKIRESDAKNRISTAEQQAVQEIRAMSTELSIRAVKEVLKLKLDEKMHDELIENSIALLKKAK